jgi:hypothetical protein
MSTEAPHLVLVVKLEQNWQTYWRTRLFLASMTYTTLSKLAPPPSSSSPLSAEVSEPTRRDKFEAVLGISDIFVRIRIRTSQLWIRIRLLFFSDFLDAKKITFFSHIEFFSCRHITFSLKNLIFCVKILFCKQSFSPLNTFMRKGIQIHTSD